MAMDSSRRRLLTRSAALAMAGAAAIPWASVLAESGSVVRLRELYNKDQSFSDLAESLAGDRIAVKGFMAPPLKANSSFFVLTKRPMTTCPFCSDVAEWPDDILAVYTKRTLEVLPFNVDIVVNGVLELGEYRDESTGFVSRVRLQDAVVERA